MRLNKTLRNRWEEKEEEKWKDEGKKMKKINIDNKMEELWEEKKQTENCAENPISIT
jgi:hypothetical protein